MIKIPQRKPGLNPSTRITLPRLTLLAWLGLLAQGAFGLDPVPPACTRADVTEASEAVDKKLVIIIDDIGNSFGRGVDALALPGKLTFAVIPHRRYSKQLAEEAHRRGKEVMLHAPMSTLEDIPLGAGGLTPALSREEFRSTLGAALEQVPHVQGINNHMGSDLTQRRRQMAWLMQDLRWNELYFVDSRTSEKTVAATVAAEFNVPNLSRQVFLDNERTAEAIDERFHALLALVEKDGLAVAIGHPYPETVSYLLEALPLLPEQGIRLVFASEAVVQAEESLDVAGINPAPAVNPAPDC